MMGVRVRIYRRQVRVRIDVSFFMVYVGVRSPQSQRTVEG